MQTESALGAQRGSYAGTPTGFRRLTPSLLQADRAAERFNGLPEEVEVHGQLLAAFKAAAPRLGLSVRLVHALDWLFRFTRAQDWEPGGRPVVWPSSSMQQEALGLSESRVKSINRSLIEAGLITMKDSPNGKRYGVRDRQGRIVEAYGFDLSPIATRYAEFVQLAAEAKAEREFIGQLRRRATIARKAIAQILETAAEYGFINDAWAQLSSDTQALITSLRRFERPEEIAISVASLERRQTEARRLLEQLLDNMNLDPKEPENRPHNIPTNQISYSSENTVVAHEGGKSNSETTVSQPETNVQALDQQRRDHERGAGQGNNKPLRTDAGTVLKITTTELTQLAPRLRNYLTSPRPAWPEVINAADWLRGELGSPNPFGARHASLWAVRRRRLQSRSSQ